MQTFLKLILAYSSLPGFYGVDEEESEMTLGFWYLFQEALWSVDYTLDDGEEEHSHGRPLLDDEAKKEKQHEIVAKAVYSELVQALRRKVIWPPASILNTWAKGSLQLSCFIICAYAKRAQTNGRNSKCTLQTHMIHRITDTPAVTEEMLVIL